MIYSNLNGLLEHSKTECEQNQNALGELFELYLLYGIVEKFASAILKVKAYLLFGNLESILNIF